MDDYKTMVKNSVLIRVSYDFGTFLSETVETLKPKDLVSDNLNVDILNPNRNENVE